MKRALLFYAAISLCVTALSPQAEERPLATRVEHFFVASDAAQALFTFFRDTFLLPEVWPFYQHGTFASGGLSLGNVVLEFALFPGKDKEPLKTEFQGIALEPIADANATSSELTKRNIPHTDARTYASQVPGRQVRAEWSSVGITDILPKSTDIFFCDYKDREGVAQGRKAASGELAKRMGGPLGIVGAAEITVGVGDLDEARNKWSALLAPSPQISEDAFVFQTGPRIRLVRSESPGILGIVLTVRSIDQAEKFLRERDLLAKDDAGHIAISPQGIEGLTIRLLPVAQAQVPAHLLLGTGLGPDHLGIGVRDLQKAKNVYEQKLGFKCRDNRPEPDGAVACLIFFDNKSYLELLSVPQSFSTATSDFHREVRAFIEKHEGAMYLGLETSSAKNATDFLKARHFEAKLSEHRRARKEGETKPSPVQVYSVEFADKSSGNKQVFMLWIYLVEYVFPERPARLAARREQGMMDHPNTALGIHSVWFAVRDLDASLQNLQDAGFEPGETREAKFLGASGREVKAGQGRLTLLQTVDDNGALSKFLSNHDDGKIIGVSIEVSDLDKARSWVEGQAGHKLEPYDGFYGRSILIPPDLTHGVWMEFFQRQHSAGEER